MSQQNKHREILVYAHWSDFTEPVFMGHLYAEITRGSEVFSFEYSEEWLKNSYAQILDPELLLYTGRQYSQKNNFGVFLDSSPDRWGRVLMKRREAIFARNEKRNPITLMESDFLLGVFDEQRMGGLRFKTNVNGPFVSSNNQSSVPPWSSIRELERISLAIEKEDMSNNPEYLNWLNTLIAPGSSLGGARPKAGVRDDNGELWIAKFPSVNDTKDIGAWEIVVHDLAVKCGIKTAAASVKKFTSNYHTYLTKRFDRIRNTRLHFSSAMTILGYSDGDNSLSGVSYLELADFIIAHGADVNNDLEELWRRIVFSISVSNTDDHLRNHGFLLSKQGWLLSPAYDINPNENGAGLSLNISENDNSQDLDLALQVAEYFRLNKNKAEEIIKKVSETVSGWRDIANKYNISKVEQDYIMSAFKIKNI
jgi:serine/threonine-protein kinase HipA